MASVNYMFLQTLSKYVSVNNISALNRFVIVAKSYSQYNPHFIEPIIKKQEQDALYESGKVENLRHLPVKAVVNSLTTSVYHDDLVQKFVNLVMRHGKKNLARELVEKAFENVKRIQLEKFNGASEPEQKMSIETNPLKIFHSAVANTKPVLDLTPIKRGGITYQVPVPLTDKRSTFVAMRWLILAAKEKERTIHFPEKLAWELVDAAHNKGKVVKKKQDLHRQCEGNRAYAHYRWS